MSNSQMYLFSLLLILAACSGGDKGAMDTLEIIPQPSYSDIGEGHFQFDEETVLFLSDPGAVVDPKCLTDRLSNAAGWDLMTTTTNKPKRNFLELVRDTSLGSESYRLSIGKESISIMANDRNGFVYGLQTVRMLLPSAIEAKEVQDNDKWIVPVLEIEDGPRFEWRGLMLDVSRHFFDTEYIKRTLDRMALLKLNVFHWHLIDDNGWRLEINKYPKLTKVGGYRVDQEDKHWNARPAPKRGEEATYGGFYTQAEVKEVVAYADKLGIMVVPEIEMPAHVMSAIASYPELSCFETPIMVPSGGVWPITEIYCAGKESTFTFLENVLDEVFELFPSRYVHIGGDEATKTNWKKCPHCQKRMKDENLENEEQLQSYFIRRMENYISSNGRELIGWDEILEGGIASGAAVMSWRGVKGGVEASNQGHKVVMTPEAYTYFNKYQGPRVSEPMAFAAYVPLKKVYDFDPIVEGMSTAQADLVLGGEANLWSEYISSDELSEYMLFPRLLAMSEALWSTKEKRSWSSFSTRLEPFFERLDAMGIAYATSAYAIRDSASIDMAARKLAVSLFNEFEDASILYSVDGQADNQGYVKYDAPVILHRTATITAVVKDGEARGIRPFERTYEFHKAVGSEVVYNTQYNSSYAGQGASTLVDVLRGSQDFHDGKWQAWLNDDIDITIDLGEVQTIEKVGLGFLQNHGPDIYLPTKIVISISTDNINFKEVALLELPVVPSNIEEVKDFELAFDRDDAQFVRVFAKNGPYTMKKGGSWLFLDEVRID